MHGVRERLARLIGQHRVLIWHDLKYAIILK